jgi:hypothetical protein
MHLNTLHNINVHISVQFSDACANVCEKSTIFKDMFEKCNFFSQISCDLGVKFMKIYLRILSTSSLPLLAILCCVHFNL